MYNIFKMCRWSIFILERDCESKMNLKIYRKICIFRYLYILKSKFNCLCFGWKYSRLIIFEDPWPSNLLPRVWQWICHYLFYDLSRLRLGFKHLIFRLHGERSTRLSHRRGKIVNENFTCFALVNYLHMSIDIEISGIWRDMLLIFNMHWLKK